MLTCSYLLKGIYLLLLEQQWSNELKTSNIDLGVFFHKYHKVFQKGLKSETRGQPTPYSDMLAYYNTRLFGTIDDDTETLEKELMVVERGMDADEDFMQEILTSQQCGFILSQVHSSHYYYD